MKSATLHQIKKELETCSQPALLEYALKLIKFKVENKEYISYLLFDQEQTESFIYDMKIDIDALMYDLNRLSLYKAQKGIRKVLRFMSRHLKYAKSKEIEAELVIHFCNSYRNLGLPIAHSKTLLTIYEKQLERIEKLIPQVHEDLQFDYKDALIGLKRKI